TRARRVGCRCLQMKLRQSPRSASSSLFCLARMRDQDRVERLRPRCNHAPNSDVTYATCDRGQMKVIFLDLDGVLNSKQTPNPRNFPFILDNALLERLKHLLQLTGAQ